MPNAEPVRVCILGPSSDLEPLARDLGRKTDAREVDFRPLESLSAVLRGATPPALIVLHGEEREIEDRIDEIRASAPAALVALWPAKPSVRGAVQAIRKGAIDYLASSPTAEAFDALVEKARLHGPPAGDDDWQTVLGQTPAIRRLLREVQTIAAHDATVLVQGETGSGKERVARLIHGLSARSGKPFVVCNCSAIVPTLAESELFGHEKGAFTGARRAKAGLFEAARGGTLFLDQIQELPLNLQPKLLRVLENREFTRLGGARPMATDVRVIAAANRDLREEIEGKRFRQDLFYRLNTATLAIPPLRERRDDIPILVDHFLAHFSRQFGKSLRSLSAEGMSRLMSHPWEGNVRELRNAIEQAVAVSRRRVITARDLPVGLAPVKPQTPVSETPAELISLDEVERNQIRRVLQLTGGNRDRAAKALGLSRSTLYRRLAELGLSS